MNLKVIFMQLSSAPYVEQIINNEFKSHIDAAEEVIWGYDLDFHTGFLGTQLCLLLLIFFGEIGYQKTSCENPKSWAQIKPTQLPE